MGKLTALVMSFLLFFDFFGCSALRVKFAEKAGLERMQAVAVPQYDENGEAAGEKYELHWNGREYEWFGFVSENSMVGELFGLTDMAHYRRVFLVADENPEDWLIWCFGDFMGVWFLCKEKSVTEITDRFAFFKEETP